MEKPKSRGGRAWQCRARPSPLSLYLVTFFGRQNPVRKVLFASWSPILTEQVLGVQPQVLVREGQIGVADVVETVSLVPVAAPGELR